MPTKSRVLVYDIETSPNLAYVWGKYDQNVISFKEEWFMLSFGYKWLGETKTHVVALDDFDLYRTDQHNDFGVVQALWKLFDEADIVIAHNGDKFDQRKANARFMYWNFKPPQPYKSIDTLKIAHKYFAFNSAKLGDLGEYLDLGGKADTGGFSTWLGCMKGDSAAWAQMKKYNKQDVVLLEKVYLKLRPWADNHPAMNLLEDRPDACPKCGGTDLQSKGVTRTKTQTYRRYRCYSCSGYCSARVAEKTTKKVELVN